MSTEQEQTIVRLCDACAAAAKRNHVSLCAACSLNFRVIFLPIECRSFGEVAAEARTDSGVDCAELVNGLMLRIFNQQRELAKLNLRISESARDIHAWSNRLLSSLGSVVGIAGEKLQPVLIDEATKIIRRYKWLRDDRAYLPEENMVRGGDDLDQLCDEGIREAHGVRT